MSIFQKLPWVALSLVLLTYSSLGWLIYSAKVPNFIWLLTVIAVLLFEGSLTALWSKLATYWTIFFRSNRRSFFFTIFMAFSLFIIIAQFRLFLDMTVIISAIMLGRLDFQVAGFSQKFAFWFMSLFSLTGLGLGALVASVMSSL
jgi:hypothetical protein